MTKVRRWKQWGMLLVVVLSSVALVLSTLAVQRNREQDEATAKQIALDAKEALIIQCEALNQSRKNIYDSNMALILLALYTSREQLQELPPLIREFVTFTKQAFEPVSCDPNDPGFSKDLTPPDSLPPNPLIEVLPA